MTVIEYFYCTSAFFRTTVAVQTAETVLMATLLYALIEQRPGHPNFGNPFYIGIGGPTRPQSHLKKARSIHGHYNLLMHSCLTDHLAEGVEPTIQILGSYESREDAGDAECEAIKRYGRIGVELEGVLCNIAPGGQGVYPEFIDPAVIARVAAAARVRWTDPDFRARREATIREISSDPEWRANVAKTTADALHKPETRANHLAALARINAARTLEERSATGKKRTPESLAKSIAALAAARLDPVAKEKHRLNTSIGQKRSWANPEDKARRKAGMKGHKKTLSQASLEARRANAKKGSTPEARAKKAAGARKRWDAPDARAKAGAQTKARWEDEEQKAAMLAGRSEGIAKSWEDPDVRARRIAGIKAAMTKPPSDGESEH